MSISLWVVVCVAAFLATVAIFMRRISQGRRLEKFCPRLRVGETLTLGDKVVVVSVTLKAMFGRCAVLHYWLVREGETIFEEQRVMTEVRPDLPFDIFPHTEFPFANYRYALRGILTSRKRDAQWIRVSLKDEMEDVSLPLLERSQ